jgi:hypothetical protein
MARFFPALSFLCADFRLFVCSGHFYYGMEVDKSQVAFSQPTSFGHLFAKYYLRKDVYLSYR